MPRHQIHQMKMKICYHYSCWRWRDGWAPQAACLIIVAITNFHLHHHFVLCLLWGGRAAGAAVRGLAVVHVCLVVIFFFVIIVSLSACSGLAVIICLLWAGGPSGCTPALGWLGPWAACLQGAAPPVRPAS